MNVAFEAHHAERNHHRRYEITIGRDLLDDWTVSIRYGRTGTGGHVLRYAGQDTAKLQAIVKERLRRRLSAPKRIGCSYEVVEMTATAGFIVEEWVLPEILIRLIPGEHSNAIPQDECSILEWLACK